jgi:hypothetical protein
MSSASLISPHPLIKPNMQNAAKTGRAFFINLSF